MPHRSTMTCAAENEVTCMQIKFYSTLTADFFPNDPTDLGDSYNESEGIPYIGEELTGYRDNIRKAIQEDVKDFNGDLMQYYHEDDLDEPLNADERQLLLTYTQQQYQSDWGRDIAEQEVEVEDGTLHLHFGSDTDLNVEIGFVSIVTKENLVERDDAMEQKKYEITDIAHPSNPKWHRIRALEYIGEDIEPGDLGGFVESEDNLSQEGVCWIFNDAIACESALVSGNAVLKDQAVARGTALVSNNAEVGGKAIVQDYAIVLEGYVSESAHICGKAKLTKELGSEGVPEISGDAFVYGTLSGSVHCRGEAIILPGTELRNPTPDLFILNGDKVYLAPGENRQDVCPQQEPKTKDIER